MMENIFRKQFILCFTFILLVVISICHAQNYRLYPSNATQTEVFLSVHPHNPNIMFGSANTIAFTPTFFLSEGVYVTTNGGNSWYGSDTCSGEPITFHGGDPGITIDKDGTFILTRIGASPFQGLFSHFSTDNGLSWSAQNTITEDNLERAAVATDGNSSSSHYGRSYAVWVKFLPPFPVYFSRTDNGGANWSTPVQVNNPSQRGAGGDVAIGPDGSVHVVWSGVTDESPFTEVFTGYAKSVDGGANWDVSESAYTTNGIQGILKTKSNIRVNGLPRIAIDHSGGSRHGWIYVVTTQQNLAPAGSDPDIIVNRSTDGGNTWSSGIRVNQDTENNGKIQYFPAIVVDQYGAVNIIYYDDRNTDSDACEVFLSRSIDGGDSWEDVLISDHSFVPIPIGGLGQGYQGDNIDVVTVGDTLWPVWMDNSIGHYQMWTSPTRLSTVDIDNISPMVPETISLDQNYPNPFNPNTQIRYALSTISTIELRIFDIKGSHVKALIHNQQQTPGEFSVNWDGTNDTGQLVSSGVYLYQLSAYGQDGIPALKTKKMLLIR